MNDADPRQPGSAPQPRQGESSLTTRAAGGDRQAMADLLTAHQPQVHAICYRMVHNAEDAADLTQDVLLKVITNLDQYDGRAAFSTWVTRIAMNASLSFLRKSKTARKLTEAGAGAADSGAAGLASRLRAKAGEQAEPEASDRVQMDENRRWLKESLTEISDDSRALLVLRDVQDLDYQQIAEVVGVPLGTVKSRLFRARLALRMALEQKQRIAGDPRDRAVSGKLARRAEQG